MILNAITSAAAKRCVKRQNQRVKTLKHLNPFRSRPPTDFLDQKPYQNLIHSWALNKAQYRRYKTSSLFDECFIRSPVLHKSKGVLFFRPAGPSAANHCKFKSTQTKQYGRS